MKYKLAAFDMDGTLIEEVNSWHALHDYFGTFEETRKHLEDYDRGIITYEEFIEQDIKAILKRHEQVHIKDIERIMNSLPLIIDNDVRITLQALKNNGINLAIISAGIDILAYRLGNELGIEREYIIANGFEVDEHGYLTGKGIARVDPYRKHEALERFARANGYELSEIITVGDSIYDISFLKSGSVGFAYRPTQALLEELNNNGHNNIMIINNMTDMLDYVLLS